MKFILQISRILVGILFIISGLIKLNDPVGTQIKLEEYFEVFGTHFLIPMALYFSVIMCVLEVALGIAVLLFYRMKWTLIILSGLIVFFTFLTFYSAYFNKVTDCGCFGDAIKLKPWESFYKDIILCVLILFIIILKNKIKPVFDNIKGDLIVIIVTMASIWLAVFCINHLNIIDFRAYKPDANIQTAMKPSCTPAFKYILTKNGKDFEFTQYPTDTTYQYKSMVQTNPECNPKITDYNIWNDQGDYTQESFKGDKMFIYILNTELADKEGAKRVKVLTDKIATIGIEPIIITASDPQKFDIFRHELNLAVPFFYADATVIKTIIRSNPGLVYLQNGTVKGKWHCNDVPSLDELKLLK